ncbi:MAG: flagellar hook-associated protein 2 [Bacillaceae bacterium]|nr:flagellar hook-associated protein 2 [Bacillaceae bacterium]
MRIGGLASGMDIDTIVEDLMKAERIPLTKMEQDKTWLTWQRDAYRDVNSLLLELDQMALDMRLSKTYNSKNTISSNESAVTAVSSSSASVGNYTIDVQSLATAAINVSANQISGTTKIDPSDTLANQDTNFANNPLTYGDLTITTYDKDGNPQTATINVSSDKSLNQVLNDITEAGVGVRAFYDENADKVVIERTETGDFNTSGAEIEFSGAASTFMTQNLQIDSVNETGGTNATFVYNNALTISTTENQYTLNGITFNFHDTTTTAAKISVNNDVDHAVEKITEFVGKYNEIIGELNDRLNEKRYRDYKPLTEEQKEEMEEREIELWEEKAKSGLLRSDSILSGGLFEMRQAWYSVVDTGDDYTHLSEIGIETSSNYLDGGKLIIDEDELRKALTEDPEAVQKLFSNDVSGDSRGLINRLEDAMEKTMNRIEERAGKGAQTLETYTMGRRLKDLDERIDAFEDRLIDIENRYWNQFTAMEKAIQRMNQQSMYLMQQFGGGM